MNNSMQEPEERAYPPRLQPILRKEWPGWLSGALFAFFLASLLLSGWPEGLLPEREYPYAYEEGDTPYFLLLFKEIIEEESISFRGGYPFPDNRSGFPQPAFFTRLLVRLTGLVGRSPAAAYNLFFLLGFAVTFVLSYRVLRSIGLTPFFAWTASLLFDFLPFHFLRLELGHIFFTWYWVVPVFFAFAFRIFFLSSFREEMRSLPGTAMLLPLLFLSASTGVYYTLFGAILLIAAGTAGTLRSGRSINLFAAAALVLLLSASLLLQFPFLRPSLFGGEGPSAAPRSFSESELYAFKPVQLLLPRSGHRISFLGEITRRYSAESPLVNENETASLGFAGTAGLGVLLFTCFAGIVGCRIDPRLRLLSVLGVVLFLFGTAGGLGSLFAMTLSPMARGWNRISVFLAFAALAALFLFLQKEIEKLSLSSKGRNFVFLVFSCLFLLPGIYDQTAPGNPLRDEETRRAFLRDRSFIGEIESSLPKGSAVYQLPFMEYPEAPPLHGLRSYGLAAGMIHSEGLRWSYGGMKGREGDFFYRALSREPIALQIETAKRLGFAGVSVDGRGYGDDGKEVAMRLRELLDRDPAVVRADGKAFFHVFDPLPAIPSGLAGKDPEAVMERAGYRADRNGPRYPTSLSEGIDFTRRGFPAFILDAEGLSHYEAWGRWSDAVLSPAARFHFAAPLPDRFVLQLTANIFGPNVGKNLLVRMGKRTFSLPLADSSVVLSVEADLRGEQVDCIEFLPPEPASPLELGLSTDARKLGIGFVRMQILQERDGHK